MLLSNILYPLWRKLLRGGAVLLTGLLFLGTALAAPTRIQGVVTDSQTAEPVIGAGVMVKGSNIGAVTDMDGRFSLDVPNLPATLVVSCLGYADQEVRVTAAGPVYISLEAESVLMDEVIVTGYGTFKKSAYAGSASNVKQEKLADVPAVSFQDMLQGNAPGVQFSQESGQPGSATSLNIRGMGSFNASNSPLYVIDGIPIRSGDIGVAGGDAGLDIMSTLNTSDIESITIIKDAAAASLYGSRAANGVIVITTKKGKTGKPQVSLKADWGMTDFAMPFRPVMDGPQRREYMWTGLYNDAIRSGEADAAAKAYADENIDKYAPIPWCGFVDWDEILFRKGSHANYEASVAGGTDRVKYFTSLNYLNQEGITPTSAMERISGRVNVEYRASDRLTLGANILFSKVNQDLYSEGTSYTSPFYSSRNCVVPSDAAYNEDGTWDRDFIRNSDRNPLLAQTYDYKKNWVTRSFDTAWAQYEFIPDLKFKSTLAYDFVFTKGKDWADPRTSNGDDVMGEMAANFYEMDKLVWTNQLTYAKTFSGVHHLDALLGFEIDDQYRDYLSGDASYFATASRQDISNGQKTEGVGGNQTESRLVSYLGRVNYDYDNRYYLGGSYRVDGSSRLHRDNRWGHFWSVSGAWRAIREEFMDPVQDWLTDLKFRASYGVNGTLPSDYYGYMGLSSISGGYNLEPAIGISQIENRDLKWETNYNLNLGVDLGLWNRVNLTVEYYSRNTRNLLMDLPISMTSGLSSYLTNIGQVRNSGVELELNTLNVSTRDFTWNTAFNLAHNKNKIVVLDGEQTEIIDGVFNHVVGHSYRTFYMIEFAGINPETGAPQFYTNTQDANGNYVKEITENSTEANAILLDKHAEPVVTGGLSNTLRYRWFDLSFLFSYQFGGYSYDNWAQKTEHGGNDMEANIPTYYADNWKKPGDISQYEIFIDTPVEAMNKVTTDRRLHSSDFIRLKTLTFGITLPQNWTKPIGVQTARVFFSANNLWTWAKYDYYDPEAVTGGRTIWGTPPLKTLTFGVNVNF